MRALSGMSRLEVLGHFEHLAVRADFSARRMAELQGVTLRHLQRYFRAQFDCTPREWVNHRRLQMARARLPTARSVKEVAYDVGFKQVSHFSREFKKAHGLRPSSLLRDTECPQSTAELQSTDEPFAS